MKASTALRNDCGQGLNLDVGQEWLRRSNSETFIVMNASPLSQFHTSLIVSEGQVWMLREDHII